MQVSVETTSGLERKMTVRVPAETIDEQVTDWLQKEARRVRVAGFRPGKVPFKEMKRRFGGQAHREVVGKVLESSLSDALAQEHLRPAGMPQIEPLKMQPGEPLEYTATFEVYPEIDLKPLTDITVTKLTAEVADTDVEAMLEKLRKRGADWQAVERAAQVGDRLQIDFEGTIDGQPFAGNKAEKQHLELGSKSMIPGFEDQLIGVSAGEQRTLQVTFPADYGSEEVAGKEAEFQVKVHEVAEAHLPDIDDAFAERFKVEGGIEAFRKEIRSNMENELTQAKTKHIKHQVLEGLLAANEDLTVPKALVDAEAKQILRSSLGEHAQISMEQLNKLDLSTGPIADQARKRVALGLLLADVKKRNHVELDPQQVEAKLYALAASYEQPEAVVNAYRNNAELLSSVESLVLEDQIVESLLAGVQVEEKQVSFDELMEAVGELKD